MKRRPELRQDTHFLDAFSRRVVDIGLKKRGGERDNEKCLSVHIPLLFTLIPPLSALSSTTPSPKTPSLPTSFLFQEPLSRNIPCQRFENFYRGKTKKIFEFKRSMFLLFAFSGNDIYIYFPLVLKKKGMGWEWFREERKDAKNGTNGEGRTFGSEFLPHHPSFLPFLLFFFHPVSPSPSASIPISCRTIFFKGLG